MIKITFLPMNETVEVSPGISLLEAAHAHDIDLEGSCEGSLACSTCHVVVKPACYSRLSAPDEDEEDLLDKAFALTSTSRLACQIILDETMDGLTVTIPAYSVNINVDKMGGRS